MIFLIIFLQININSVSECNQNVNGFGTPNDTEKMRPHPNKFA